MRTHGENEIGVAHELARQRLRAMGAEIHVPLHADEQRAVARRRAVVRARAGADRLDVRAGRARWRSFARSLQRADCGRCCRCRRTGSSCRHASPIKLGTLSRSVLAAIAPGRITRGRRPVQSSTVDGCDGVSVPPSSTRSRPAPPRRPTAQESQRLTWPAEPPGGWRSST